MDQLRQILSNFIPSLQFLLDELGNSILITIDLSLFLLEHIYVRLFLLFKVKFNVSDLRENLFKSLDVLSAVLFEPLLEYLYHLFNSASLQLIVLFHVLMEILKP